MIETKVTIIQDKISSTCYNINFPEDKYNEILKDISKISKRKQNHKFKKYEIGSKFCIMMNLNSFYYQNITKQKTIIKEKFIINHQEIVPIQPSEFPHQKYYHNIEMVNRIIHSMQSNIHFFFDKIKKQNKYYYQIYIITDKDNITEGLKLVESFIK